MARRNAKRATRPNPREERNLPNFITEYKGGTLKYNPKAEKPKKIVVLPRNINQEQYLDMLNDEVKPIIVAVGPAGTGKTMLATHWALEQFTTGNYSKIVITRPNIACDDKDIGYLPGDIDSKMLPWLLPIFDYFKDIISQKILNDMIRNETLEIVPMAFIRGRTFKDAVIIIDEAQNLTTNSMLAVLTRLGENSKMIITGDNDQSDRGRNNGLKDLMEKTANSKYIGIVQFTGKDVERHPAIKEILNIYKKDEQDES